MDIREFQAIITGSPPADRLILQGRGEPTLHPDLAALLAIAQRDNKFGTVDFYTNGLAQPPAYFTELRQYGLSTFVVSVDSLTPAIARACRAGTDVDKIMRLLVATAEVMKPQVSIVLSKKNIADLPSTLSRLQAIGPIVVYIQPLLNFRREAGDFSKNQYLLDDGDVVTYLAMRVTFAEKFPNIDLRDSVVSFLEDKVGERENTPRVAPGPCRRPFLYPYVTVEGFLTPCCHIYDPGTLGNKNLAVSLFQEAWRSSSVQEWLNELVHGNPAACRECYLNPNYALKE